MIRYPAVATAPTRRLRRIVLRSALTMAALTGLVLAPLAVDAVRARPFDVDADRPVTTDRSTSGDDVAGDGRAAAVAAQPDDRDTTVSDLPIFTHRSARVDVVARTPVAVRIDALGIDARVVPRGTDARQQLDVPPDGSTVVWYRAGSVPGAAGSAVLAAHVDHAGKPGVFFRLDRLGPGDTVAVELDDGTTRRFEVVRRRRYAKERLPVDRLFTRNGDAVLTLITCGGQFNATTRHYDANTVVQATLR